MHKANKGVCAYGCVIFRSTVIITVWEMCMCDQSTCETCRLVSLSMPQPHYQSKKFTVSGEQISHTVSQRFARVKLILMMGPAGKKSINEALSPSTLR